MLTLISLEIYLLNFTCKQNLILDARARCEITLSLIPPIPREFFKETNGGK